MVSKTKKVLDIRPDGANGFRICWAGGGELPLCLKSAYTSIQEATKAIQIFQATKNAKTAAN